MIKRDYPDLYPETNQTTGGKSQSSTDTKQNGTDTNQENGKTEVTGVELHMRNTALGLR